MENVIEIRHYVSRIGKDIFNEWLTALADGRRQGLLFESTGSPQGILAAASR
jgi:hypothetical protein